MCRPSAPSQLFRRLAQLTAPIRHSRLRRQGSSSHFSGMARCAPTSPKLLHRRMPSQLLLLRTQETHSVCFITRRFLLLAVLFLGSSFAHGVDCYTAGFNCTNLDTQIKGSRLPFFGTDSGSTNTYVLTTIAPLGPALR